MRLPLARWACGNMIDCLRLGASWPALVPYPWICR